MKTFVKAALTTCCLLPFAAHAGGHMKPGLWEISTKMNLGAGAPQIPPEQLAQMKAMGIKIPGMGGDPIVIKQCITAEQAERDVPPRGQQNDKSGCEMQNAKHDGNSFSAEMVCNGEMKGKGEMKATYASNESYTSSMHFKGSQGKRPGEVEMTSESSGKWLGADCGDVKPHGG